MISFELNRRYKYNVVVGKPVGLQSRYYTNSKVKLFLIKAYAWLTNKNVKVYTAGINYTLQARKINRKTRHMG
nr:MAG TPA: hypothetical protein [Caudoviricetes sp.]